MLNGQRVFVALLDGATGYAKVVGVFADEGSAKAAVEAAWNQAFAAGERWDNWTITTVKEVKIGRSVPIDG
jgi:hypothetical protein